MKRRYRNLHHAIALSMGIAAASATATMTWAQAGSPADKKTLRVVPHADLSGLDPTVSSATITAGHSYMVYDMLFALDESMAPQPQMVERFTVSPDQLSYRFTLREGLVFHDGTPVTAEDCVASIKRWAVADGTGQLMTKVLKEYKVADQKTFEIVLNEPFGLMLQALAKPTANLLPIMPKRLAESDPAKPVSDPIGSGPFVFVKEEWVPGTKIVYRKFDKYVPRKEPPSAFAGGKIAKVDRVEWHIVRDPFTALNGVRSGEFDFWEQPPLDVAISARSTRGLVVKKVNPLGDHGVFIINHLQPPFDKPQARQALLRMIKQTDYLKAIATDPEYYLPCKSFLACNTPYQTDAGSEILGADDPAAIKALLKEAGWDNAKPIIVLQPTDRPAYNADALIIADAMRKHGINVKLLAMDWAAVRARRNNKGDPMENGWNLFATDVSALLASNPATNLFINAGCDKAWIGWPCDDKIEALRAAFVKAPDDAARKKIAEDLNRRAYEHGVYAPLGQYSIPVIHRESLQGVLSVPNAYVYWNIEKR
jgi:peptide/nickel transport system substrate-binding protein